jgi:hypothetical protein
MRPARPGERDVTCHEHTGRSTELLRERRGIPEKLVPNVGVQIVNRRSRRPGEVDVREMYEDDLVHMR